jgi:LPXTG-site transpeptidase (sortase) family protein
MERFRSSGLILLGILLAVLSANRTAPDLVQAFSGCRGQTIQYGGLMIHEEGAAEAPSSALLEPKAAAIPANRPGFPPQLSPSFLSLAEVDLAVEVPYLGDFLDNEGESNFLNILDPHKQNSPSPANRPDSAAPNPLPGGELPIRIMIPSIYLDAPINPATSSFVNLSGQEFQQWLAPNEFAAGWHEDSALLGLPGNTVLNGHHNIHGEVFKMLVQVEAGQMLFVSSHSNTYAYVITNNMILREKYELIDTRMENARWIMPSNDERITLITCWPYESNTHRLILVARPIAVNSVLERDISQ